MCLIRKFARTHYITRKIIINIFLEKRKNLFYLLTLGNMHDIMKMSREETVEDVQHATLPPGFSEDQNTFINCLPGGKKNEANET